MTFFQNFPIEDLGPIDTPEGPDIDGGEEPGTPPGARLLGKLARKGNRTKHIDKSTTNVFQRERYELEVGFTAGPAHAEFGLFRKRKKGWLR